MCVNDSLLPLGTNAGLHSRQVEMQRNLQMFWSFDADREITEHVALPGTVLGKK